MLFKGNGKKIDDGILPREFYSAAKTAGLKYLRFRDFRHTFAERLTQAADDLDIVQKLGRWKNISAVRRYVPHFRERVRPGVKVLERISKKLAQI